jgi:hypothetical protein
MSETDPRETKGLPDAVSEEANATKQAHNDKRRTEIQEADEPDEAKDKGSAQDPQTPIRTQQTRS